MRWPWLPALVAGAVLGAMGCGDDGGSSEKPRLVVSAAASMTEALRRCSGSFEEADVRLSFAGSDELAGQIRRGIKPDVYAAANAALPERLSREGLLERPVRFATNELVIALPADSRIGSIHDLARDGVALAIGAESVPVGAYTRRALSRLPADAAGAILANVRSNEPDVRGIVGKLTQGAADAGFVYITDVNATGGELKAIELPNDLEPQVSYGAGVVRRAEQPERAERFVNGLRKGDCADALREAGFGPAP